MHAKTELDATDRRILRILGQDGRATYTGILRESLGAHSPDLASGFDVKDIEDVPVIPLPFAKVPPHPPLARGRVAAIGVPVVTCCARTRAGRSAADAGPTARITF